MASTLTSYDEVIDQLTEGQSTKVEGLTITKSASGAYTVKGTPTAAQNITLGGTNGWTISLSGSLDNKFTLDENVSGPISVSTGSGNDTFEGLTNAPAGTVINGGDGNNKFLKGVTAAAGYSADSAMFTIDDVAVEKGISVKGGKGTDLAEVGIGDTVTLGRGADTVSLVATTDAQGANVAGTAIWTDYTYNDKDVVQIANAATLDHTVYNQDGTIADPTTAVSLKLGSKEASNYKVIVTADGTGTDGSDGTTRYVWFAGKKGSTMNANGSTNALIMIGDNNDTQADNIVGGIKGDTIYAGNNDTVNGGSGADSIILTADNGYRETVVLGAKSDHDTVLNFVGGTGSNSDVLSFGNGFAAVSSVNYDGTDATVTMKDGASMLVQGLGGYENGSGIAELLVGDGTNVKNAAAVQSGSTGIVEGDTLYDYYVGSGSALDFTEYTGVDYNLAVDLGNTGKFGATAKFSGINAVYGMNADNNTIVGAAGVNNTLAAGSNSYFNSVWGGGLGRDSLVGSENAYDTFFYGSGDDMDTISNFNLERDTIYVHSGNARGAVRSSSSSGDIKFVWDDNNVLTVQTDTSEVDKAIRYTTDGVAKQNIKVGITDAANTFTYESNVNAYYGGSQGDTLVVNTADNEKVWLDGSKGKAYVGITTINGSSSTGAIELAGSGSGDVITGGAGETSLWGGAGMVGDTMVGGSGSNTFYFGVGDGSDVIASSNDSDKVMLYNVAANQIASAGVTDAGEMVISLTDGSKLTMSNYSSAGATTFQIADGTTYTYNKETNSWN